ncbi:hypothetical protein F25303_4569 [Fusarium sp. NRRL 25303]|nr:hypothetical protein F25303_4569 [Fusarium sp. NRRL 25303]
MNSPAYEERKRNREEMDKDFAEAFRHLFYVRNKNIPLTPEAMDALEFSILQNMAKFKVEFESNDEKLHITLPKIEDKIACMGQFRHSRELQAALDLTKISTYFLIDTARCYESHIQDLKRIVSQTQDRHQKCGGFKADIENQQEILSIFERGFKEHLESSRR